MFIIKIESSSDPVLKVLHTSPEDLVNGKVYPGYALLLFGEFDEAVATLFARSMAAFDSVSGGAFAVFVFARNVSVSI